MKSTLKIFAICLITTVFASCRKDIPSDKLAFIGDWECVSCTVEETKTLSIKSNGKGEYKSLEPGKTFNISGNVKFDGSNFRIGGAIIKKKFTTDKYPLKEIITLQPYKYKWTARFSGDDYEKIQ
jgi:hypothetical protein